MMIGATLTNFSQKTKPIMAPVAITVVPQYGVTIRAIIPCGTLPYEIVGPVISKLCLKAAGEIQKEDKKSKAGT